jgi:hypothetical protein
MNEATTNPTQIKTDVAPEFWKQQIAYAITVCDANRVALSQTGRSLPDFNPQNVPGSIAIAGHPSNALW